MALPLVAAIAACGGDVPDPDEDSRQAEGEVLEGTISDAMIPIDQLRSQGRPLEPAVARPAEGGESLAEVPSGDSQTATGEPEEPGEPAGGADAD